MVGLHRRPHRAARPPHGPCRRHHFRRQGRRRIQDRGDGSRRHPGIADPGAAWATPWSKLLNGSRLHALQVCVQPVTIECHRKRVTIAHFAARSEPGNYYAVSAVELTRRNRYHSGPVGTARYSARPPGQAPAQQASLKHLQYRTIAIMSRQDANAAFRSHLVSVRHQRRLHRRPLCPLSRPTRIRWTPTGGLFRKPEGQRPDVDPDAPRRRPGSATALATLRSAANCRRARRRLAASRKDRRRQAEGARRRPQGVEITPVDVQQATRDSIRALMLIRAYRMRGHLHAELDPLGLDAAAGSSRTRSPRLRLR